MERKGDIYMRLAKALFTYRTTPQNTTGISPAELLVGRKWTVRHVHRLHIDQIHHRIESVAYDVEDMEDNEFLLHPTGEQTVGLQTVASSSPVVPNSSRPYPLRNTAPSICHSLTHYHAFAQCAFE